MMGKDALLVLSGGMDSVTLLYDMMESIAMAVSFDYGSRHNCRELPLAAMHCRRLSIPTVAIDLGFPRSRCQRSLLVGGEPVPEGHYEEENMKSTVVPFRNGIMLAVAVGLAESNGLKRVLLANHGGDHAIYPDCRPEFIGAMDAAARAGTYEGVRVEGPYTNLTKADIARRGKALGLDYAETWSCYKGGERHCGRCGTCVERREALSEAGIIDTTEYES